MRIVILGKGGRNKEVLACKGTYGLPEEIHVQTNGRERVKARRDGVTGDGLSGGGGGRSRVLGAGDARNDTGAHQAR